MTNRAESAESKLRPDSAQRARLGPRDDESADLGALRLAVAGRPRLTHAVDLAALVQLAIADAHASLVAPSTLWLAPELDPSRALAPTGIDGVALALIPIEAVDASGHTSIEVDAPRVWGVCDGSVRFVDGVLRGARLERVYMRDAMLTFDVEPVAAWHVRRVGTGISARDVQRTCAFPLFAAPDLAPLRAAEP